MEAEEDYKRKERIALVTILVLASVAVASLFLAFSYYCYITSKVSKRQKNRK
ncbi:non-specific serine,threonine protein kinase, partial [Sarracenia purpurea var. burkii]